jgi:hypothetical protein
MSQAIRRWNAVAVAVATGYGGRPRQLVESRCVIRFQPIYTYIAFPPQSTTVLRLWRAWISVRHLGGCAKAHTALNVVSFSLMNLGTLQCIQIEVIHHFQLLSCTLHNQAARRSAGMFRRSLEVTFLRRRSMTCSRCFDFMFWKRSIRTIFFCSARVVLAETLHNGT